MKHVFAAAALAAVLAISASSEVKVASTVLDPKTGRPVKDLKPADFQFFEDKVPKPVQAAEYTSGLLDILLLVDTSMAGPMVAPLAAQLIQQLQDKEQMGIVSVHSSADVIQDFTSSKDLLQRALSAIKFGNSPNPFDALYAAADSGFQHSSFRRVAILLTSGLDAGGRTNERAVIRHAKRNSVSIFPVYVSGWEKSRFDRVARETGGAPFNLRDLRRAGEKEIARLVFETVRSYYVLTLPGSLALGEKIRIEINRPGKLFASTLPLE